METVSALVTADFRVANRTFEDAPKVSLISRMLGALRRAAADRNLRDQLAGMDDAMLRDIGIAADEIHRIRSRDRFTPRAWAVAAGV